MYLRRTGQGQNACQEVWLEDVEPVSKYREVISPDLQNLLKLKLWELDGYVIAMSYWFEAGTLGAFLGAGAYADGPKKMVTNLWPKWEQRLSEFAPVRLLMRRAVDRQMKAADNIDAERVLPESSFSTAGCLWILADRAKTAQRSNRSECIRNLQHFLTRLTTNQVLKRMEVNLCESVPALGATPVVDDTLVILNVVDGVVDLEPLLLQLEEGDAVSPGLHSILLAMQRGRVLNTRVSLAELLTHAWKLNQMWLFIPVMQQVAEAIEAFIHNDPNTITNPLDSCTQLPGRWDVSVLDSLFMGEAQTGAPRAHLKEAHMRAYLTLVAGRTKTGRRRHFSIDSLRNFSLWRYAYVGKQFLQTCRRFSIALDGTRLGARDILLMALMGIDDDGHAEVMWLPPQAALSNPFHICIYIYL